MTERLLQMMVKEFIQVFRDPRMRAVVIVVPLLQTLVFGYAVTTDVKNIQTVILDQDKSSSSRTLIHKFISTPYFDMESSISNIGEGLSSLDRGKAELIIHIPFDFQEDLVNSSTPRIQIIIDGSNALTAGVILSYSQEIILSYLSEQLLTKHHLSPPGIEVKSRAWYNSNLQSKLFYIPGILVMMVMIITLLLSSMSIVRETEIGTIEQIMVTPIKKGEFIAGKTLPFALIGMMDVLLVCLVAVFWFKIPFRGNLLWLLAANSLFLLSTLGVGLFISTLSNTQQQAMLSTFFFMVPALLLSGFIFPLSNMPSWIQYLTYLNPLRYMIIITRGIFLKGIGFDVLYPQFIGLAVLGISLLGMASMKFTKTWK